MNTPSPRRARRTWRGRLGFALASLVIGLTLAELGARGLALSRGRSTSPSALREEVRMAVSRLIDDLPGTIRLDQLETQARRRFQPHPFTGWDNENSQRVTRRMLDDFATGKAKKSYTIMIVGGSVSGIFASKNGASWKFQQLLEADPRFAGIKSTVYTQGRSAWKQPQQLMLFAHMLTRGVKPDLLINLDGFNEVALTHYNHTIGADPLYPSMPQWTGVHSRDVSPDVLEARRRVGQIRVDAADVAVRGTSGLRLYSLLWTELTLRGLAREAGAVQEQIMAPGSRGAALQAIRGRGVKASSERVVKSGVDTWERASLAMDALCRANGVRYLHVLQPTLHDPGSKIPSKQERRQGGIADSWLRGVTIGYPLLREAGQRLAAAGISFCDGSRVFEGHAETLYYDNCHFGKAGNLLLAEAMASRFLADLPPGPAK